MFKRASTLLLTGLVFALLAGCTTLGIGGRTLKGSGKYATRDYPLSGFTGITACCGFKVRVTGGNGYKVSVTADDNVLDVLSVRTEGDTLHIEVDTAKAPSINTTRLEAAVTMPTLNSVTLSGGTQMELGQPAPQAGNLVLNLSGGSRAAIPGLSAENANVTLSGGSNATIKVTGTLGYDVSGGSQLLYTGRPTVGTANTSGGASASAY